MSLECSDFGWLLSIKVREIKSGIKNKCNGNYIVYHLHPHQEKSNNKKVWMPLDSSFTMLVRCYYHVEHTSHLSIKL